MFKRSFLLGIIAGFLVVIMSAILIGLDKASHARNMIKRKWREGTLAFKRLAHYTNSDDSGMRKKELRQLHKHSSAHTQ